MEKEFMFMVRSEPGFYHKATVMGERITVQWDAEYAKAMKPAWTLVDVWMVRDWIKNGGWVVGPPNKEAVELRRQLIQLRIGFDAMEESFHSLREEFERLQVRKGVIR